MLTAKNPWLMPGTYVLIILGFFLPFCNIKCGGMNIATVQGTDMIIKGDVAVSSELGGLESMGDKLSPDSPKDKKDRKADINIWIIISAVAALGGLAVHFLKLKPQHSIQLVIGLVGIAALIAFAITKNSFFDVNTLGKEAGSKDGDSPLGGNAIINISLAVGFWVCAAGFAFAAWLGYSCRPLDKPTTVVAEAIVPVKTETEIDTNNTVE